MIGLYITYEPKADGPGRQKRVNYIVHFGSCVVDVEAMTSLSELQLSDHEDRWRRFIRFSLKPGHNKNLHSDMCIQRKFRSARMRCLISLRCTLYGKPRTQGFFMRTPWLDLHRLSWRFALRMSFFAVFRCPGWFYGHCYQSFQPPLLWH